MKAVYLLGQDYSFGQAVAREARRQLAIQRPDVRIVGDELHPMLRIKDFAPYAAKIKASGAEAVITGNFSNDLTLLVKAAREAGFEGKFYTFYGNALGAPAAIGEAGVGKVIAVADWLPNVQTAPSEAFYRSFRQRYPQPADDYVHMRMQLMIEALAQAIAKAGDTEAVAVARALEHAAVNLQGQRGADARGRPPVSAATGGGDDGSAGRAGREIRRGRLGLRLSRDQDDPARRRPKCPRRAR